MNRRRVFLSLAPALVAHAWGVRAWAAAPPRAAAVPGGVARIRLGASERAPRVHLEKDRVLVVREGDEWIAVVGIALSSKPGSKVRLRAEHAGGRREQLEVEVVPKAYGSQHLKVPPGQVDLSAEDLARYTREREHLAAVLRTFTESPPASLAMLQPARGRSAASSGCSAISTTNCAAATAGWTSPRPGQAGGRREQRDG